ncbi:hypothetical protein N0V92_007903 [Colletotrichum tropicale]|nr:hypothetical protein N0V92_007903 [Colletotrichum tropicale]
MSSRRRVDLDELPAHIEANNRAAKLLLASFNDPSIRTFSSGFTGGPSAPPQTPQPRRPTTCCFTRFGAQRDPPPPPPPQQQQQQQQTKGYHAAPRRQSVSAPRHDFHDRDCGDRPRRDALPDAALVSEGADGALDSESTADGAVETGGGAQDAGLDEENVQTPAEPTPTWGSSKTFLEATVDEAMDQGKYMATLDSIWPKTRDWAADGDETEAYAEAVCQLAATKWGKLTVRKVKLKLNAIREGTYRELSRRNEKQYSFTDLEYRALRDSGFVKVIKWEVNDIPPFDERFRDYLQENKMKTAVAVQPAPAVPKPVQDARVEDQRRRLSELALHCLRDHVMPGDMTSYMTDLADHAASLLNLRNKDDMRLSDSDVDAVISDQWRVYNGDGKVIENAKTASSWYWSRKQEKQTQQKQQTQRQQQTPNVVHTSWLPPALAAPPVASAFSLPSRTRPPHGFPHSRR